jgi:hypothetical protein
MVWIWTVSAISQFADFRTASSGPLLWIVINAAVVAADGGTPRIQASWTVIPCAPALAIESSKQTVRKPRLRESNFTGLSFRKNMVAV